MGQLEKLKSTAKAVDFAKQNGIYIVLLVLVGFFSIATENFLVSHNLINVARQVSMLGIAAVGFAFVLLLGGIDLSVGSVITLVNVVCGWFMVNAGMNPVLAIFITLAMATFIGFTNGWIIANLQMPPLIVTLAMMIIIEGVAFIISKGLPIYGFPESFAVIGQGYIGPIPVPVVIMIAVLALGAFILNKTYFGRYFYAVGGNEEAAKLSGIKVKNVKYLVYSLSGFFAGVAGVVILSRTNSATVTAGKGLEFEILTACVLGGISVTGGFGRISNIVAGVLILGVLSNGMVLMNVTEFTQMVIKGSVLLIAVAFDCLQHRKTS
ncbi:MULTISPECIES: ABC transporter permease [unclassified Lentimonas]|uniref:ABC transporter permease n=1 Tax=unclassified Lentimonas TaxID=2630993 RepID=UPI001327A92B|nr:MULTISPECIES: ABC transporter permease [unclassified Lentimonas]CAA6679876.1 Ribose ABC transport system, permease protein RbsC (TC 3.A.1.2.1) [Lentimonas sp. CC4]CAA6685610.1 Ribose ABC transport system, permease protein RbsC (TC 3.A.1.2.1) [Lentimonas sp. CC6]CAA6689645.1 Ribose ABC transport system, permease protein RbsC (TC 3.A.1.2.1) [Lentimonas sp. CC19]CAA6692642.1 Ribose ABC transport system, permease protein RbsC (TC 3.A.1.2.1) [Lentimonas sp. CC10]CAA7069235.1 Ribose ABC transport